jgi:hypothetical protein
MTTQQEQPEQLLGMIVHKEFPDEFGPNSFELEA